MSNKLIGVAGLFAAGSILVAGTPILGSKDLGPQASASVDHRCGGGRRCGGRHCGGGGRHCGGRSCGSSFGF
jgi:hypothetical protein